jgi:hypothetical protein
MRTQRDLIALTLVAASALGACGSSSKKSPAAPAPAYTTAPASSTTTAGPPYHPTVIPSQFTHVITNPYFPLEPGKTRVYDGTRDGQPQHTEMSVTKETRMIMGVKCIVVRDVVTSSGALVEKTTDWYAQHQNGDVWYFGESTAEYTNGKVSSTHGTWEAGVDGAQPGIIMLAKSKPGDHYRQEYRPGEAEDEATVLRIDPSVKVPGGTFSKIVVTEDRDPLNPDKTDLKKYAPGVGLVYSKRVRTGHNEVISYVKTTTG